MGYRTSSAKRASAQSAKASSIVVLPSLDGTGPTLSGSGISATTPIKTQVVSVGSTAAASTTVSSGLKITNVYVTDSSYNILDDTALDPAGGYLKIIGTGFLSGCAAYINGSALTTSFVSSTEVRVVVPASSVGTYSMMLFNTDGNGAIYLNLGVSNLPTFTTSAGSLGSIYETAGFTQSVSASGDSPFTYSLYSGSLPAGATLNSDGTITGTSQAESGSSTYSFVVNVKDAQGQDATRSFSLTINTDVVSWSSPTSNQVISSYEYTPISNVTASATSAAGYGVLYSANTVPTGISLNANTGVISGTVNTVGNTDTRLTATANTTGRNATRDIQFVVNPDVVTWSSPANNTSYTVVGGSAIANVTLSATSAAGFGVQYSANALPTGVSLNNGVISGTPTTQETINTLLTATANTTGRSSTRYISWSVSLGDIYWKYVTLLLNGSTPTTTFIDDASSNDTQLTIVGDTRPNNFNPYSQGYYSNYFDGTGDYLSGSTSAVTLGSGDYTIEFWMNTTQTDAVIIDTRASASTTGWLLAVTTGYAIGMTLNGTSILVSSNAFTPGIWNHIAVVRSSGVMKIYINGTNTNNVSNASNWAPQNFNIGQKSWTSSGVANFTGWLSNLRILVGTALYNSNFTPSTTPLTAVANTSLLTCQSNRLIDNSTNNFVITKNGDTTVSSTHPFSTVYQKNTPNYYSNYFNGSTDYLTIPADSAFNIPTNTTPFTIECWVLLTSSTVQQYIFTENFNSNDVNLVVALNDGTATVNTRGMYPVIGHYVNGTWTAAARSTTALSVNTWYHLAFVFTGSSTKIYINGVDTTVAGSSSTWGGKLSSNGDSWWIGRRWDTAGAYGSYTQGYISNFRFITNQALFTGNFTPSTTPLTNNTVGHTGVNAAANITGTVVLLTCQSNSIINNSGNALTITQNGSVKPSSITPFETLGYTSTQITTYGSAYFDGTGDYLISGSSNYNSYSLTSTSQFTLECWIYRVGNGSGGSALYDAILGTNSGGTTSSIFGLYITRSNSILNFYNSSGLLTSTGTIPLNAWTHVAVSRDSGGTLRIFMNGVTVYSATNSGTATFDKGLYIGYDNTGTNYPFNGYISDLKYVVGTALYTSNFLPSQAPLTPVANTQLLTCQTNGGATNNGFVDQSSFNNIITRNGNATQGTFSPYGDNWSNYFDGNGSTATNTDALTVADNASLELGSSDFTWECWVNLTATPATSVRILDKDAVNQSSYIFYISATSYPSFVFSTNGTTQTTLTATSTVSVSTWTHLAVTRSGNTFTFWINGVSAGTSTNNVTIYNGTATLYIGNASSSDRTFPGYISNLRLVVGSALYTTSFTPSTSPLTAVANTKLLTCQSNSLIDNSPNNFTITKAGDVSAQKFSPFSTVTVPKYYSTIFNGTSDAQYVVGTTPFQFSTGDFTVETWIYPTANGSDGYSYITGTYDGANGGWAFYLSSNTNLVFRNGDSSVITSSATTISLNTWHHVAAVRSSGSLSFYLDGTKIGTSQSFTADITRNNTYGCSIGRYYTSISQAGGYWPGFISNLRVTKGQALYTGNFTPATATLTSTSVGTTGDNVAASLSSANVSLLTCQNNTFVDNSLNNYTITSATTTVKPLPVSPFTPTANTNLTYSPSVFGGSMYFDGTGDYLSIPFTNNFFDTFLGTSGYVTIECWVYRNATGVEHDIAGTRPAAASQGWGFRINATNYVQLYFTGGGSVTGSVAIPSGSWTHIAFVRNGATGYIYINGKLDVSGSMAAGVGQTTGSLYVGYDVSGGGYFNGYISDLRIVPGTTLYTSNFYPGVAPLTPTTTVGANTYSSTLLLTGTSGGIIDQSRTVDLETVGNVQLANTSPYAAGGKSYYFDGTGDYFYSGNINNINLLNFGTGDVTIECWMYLNTTSGTQTIASKWLPTIESWIWQFTSTTMTFIFYQTVSTFAWTPATGTWYHLAICRSGTNLRFFVNGVQTGATATNAGNASGTSTFAIGANTEGPQQFLNGYIADLRITKGYARYTTTFTPPTSTLVVK